MVGRSRTGCGFRWRCSTPCAARGPITSRCRSGFRRSTGRLGHAAGRFRRSRAHAQGAFLRHHRRLRRSDRRRREAAVWPSVSDAVRRPDSSRGGDRDHGRRQHLVISRREYDSGRRSCGPVRAGAGALVGSVLDASRGVRARLSAPLARSLRDARQIQTEACLMAPVTYSSYLQLDKLLALQLPREGQLEHDETLFVIIHQVYELWFKEVLHELDYLQRLLRANDTPLAAATLKRILTILKTLVAQIDVLETITPLNFLAFRDRLESGSGFQSHQFREIEFILGKKGRPSFERYPEDSENRKRVERRFSQPTLWDAFLHYLAANKYPVAKTLLQRDYSEAYEPSPEVQRILVEVYKKNPAVSQIAERLVDLDEGFMEWRYRHVKMVQRTIGTKAGTGGSAGAEYLLTTLNQPAFPDLWVIRSEL